MASQGAERIPGEALRGGSDEALHEWRKRAKDPRYPMADAAHKLTDLLGQDHDLAVLRRVVEGELKDVCPDEERALLAPLVVQLRSELKEEAREFGLKVFAEQDDQFIDRLHGYWKAWVISPP